MQMTMLWRARLAPACLMAVFWSLNAADAQVTQATATKVPQKVWAPGEVHTGNTRIYVHVFKTGIGHEHAVVGMVQEGVIHLGATQNAGRVVADLTSFVADLGYARKLLGLPGTTDPDTQKK